MNVSTEAVTIEVKDSLIAIDPCYWTDDGTNDIDGLGFRIEDAGGEWIVTTETKDEGAWGVRVAKLIAAKSGAAKPAAMVGKAVLGVDAGLMAFADEGIGAIEEWSPFCSELFAIEEKMENAYQRPKLVAGRAVSSSGFGDGVYELRVGYDRDGRPVRAEVDFGLEDDDGAA